MLEQLQQLLSSKQTKSTIEHLFKNKNRKIYDWIVEQTIDIENISISERVYIILNGRPSCKNLIYQNFKNGYRFCNNRKSCECKSIHYDLNKEDIIKKRKNTNIEKYGVEFNSQIDEIKNKKRDTCLEKFGETTNLKTDSTKEKIKKTNIEKYGFKSPQQNSEIKQKTKNTCIKKYGVSTILQTPEIRKKVMATLIQRYGTPFTGQVHMDAKTHQLINNKECFIEKYNDIGIAGLENEYNITIPTIYRNLRKYGVEIFRTQIEEKIYEIIKNCISCDENDIIRNTKSVIHPYELDIYLPKQHIAIEICGLYWHSENSKGRYKNYHYNKLKLCNDKNIRLITIFSDEIEYKFDIVKNRLIHFLGENKNIIHARKCAIKNIDNDLYRDFLTKTHIQGVINAKYKIGAFYNDQLVAVMSFGKLRKSLGSNNKDNVYELLRFSTNCNIPGIASKMFFNFIKNVNPDKVISYCDLRWGTGDVYEKMGFNFDGITPPNYWYTKNYNIREHRYKYNKHTLIEQGYDSTKTEWQIMQERGYDRIWDCGSKRFIWYKNHI